MNRDYLIRHLLDNDCSPNQSLSTDLVDMWQNDITGDICNMPMNDEFGVTTWCHIINQLRIEPPLEFDSYYHVYLGLIERINSHIN